ncbi:hypothetical protein B0A79_15375 [Flavobacterium piscis]|uniref:HNH endonuclease n=1 Tax=Flavobacterium piscis TaxID=1114874 RepID=A0ABX2XH70_9FLAO|nr:hypothetical protein [Flavobacterium piscis]OCB73171.1 hypothetical protein FLP_10635 [Flavobacterium piscis]OXG02824.1 hypothetical protein B0A79_15375 [Flavobacterium piscis]
MIAIHINKVKVVQKQFLSEIENQRIKALKNLNSLNVATVAGSDKTYLESVISLFHVNSDILLWDSAKLSNVKTSLGNVPLVTKNYKGVAKQVKSDIKNKILKALGYTELRSKFYPKYFKEIGIKACVYCNSQLTISAIKNSKNEYSAKFDVDHYHSKDDYPFLSICLFNLYPACASCNRLKSTNIVEFDLYSNELNKTTSSEYKFKLDAYSKAKYLTTKDSDVINFTFVEPVYLLGGKAFNELFHIEGIYKTQNDLIEELIIKSQIYNKAYLKTLKSNFSKLSLHPELFKRTLVGNYTEDKDLHKRPMSKLMMDIAKDLGLVK